MENKCCANWNFSGSHAARDASKAHLGYYSSQIFDKCNPHGQKKILPPLGEPAMAHKVAEDAVVQAVRNGKGNAYAPSLGLPAAKRAVAEYLNSTDDLPKQLAPEDVFMTVGCKQAIELAVDILAKPEANVLLPSPGWPWDVARCIYQNLKVKTYKFLPNYEIDFQSVRDQADKNTFAIFIINPHNPNGNTYSEDHLKDLANLAKDHGMMVVSDEVFRWTVFGDNPFVPMATFSNIVPVMTLGSISKGWSLPGWRTGWLALHDLDGVFDCTRIFTSAKEILGITSKPPTVIQAAIPAILKDIPDDFFDERLSFLKDKAQYAFDRVDDIATLTCYMKPEACTFIWTELHIDKFVDIEDDFDFCKKLAAEENLMILPGIAFGLSGWARHSIDMDSSTLEDAFDRLERFCTHHSEWPSPHPSPPPSPPPFPFPPHDPPHHPPYHPLPLPSTFPPPYPFP